MKCRYFCRLPLDISPVYLTRGISEDKALIFKKSDVEDLREKLQEACDHPEMVMKMKNQAADFICEKYNWDEVVKETMKLYRRK